MKSNGKTMGGEDRGIGESRRNGNDHSVETKEDQTKEKKRISLLGTKTGVPGSRETGEEVLGKAEEDMDESAGWIAVV